MYDELEQVAPSDYEIEDVKEKWGMLDIFDWHGNEKTDEVIHKYVELSKVTCVNCGKPATRRSTGWISPYCNDCGPEYEKFISLG